MKFEIENQWLLIAKKNRKVAASFWLFEQARPKVIHPKLHKKKGYALAYFDHKNVGFIIFILFNLSVTTM